MDVIEFKDIKTTPDIIHPYTSDIESSGIPIIIDNGSYISRVGWASHDQPVLTFKNLIAKPRRERSKKDSNIEIQAPPLQVGNDILNIEAVRFQLKTQFDKNIVTHFEAQEHLFDYTFTHLGIDVERRVPHPIVLTEALLTPNSSRSLMSELLFECYSVPHISYGIDALFGYHFASSHKRDALILNLGHHTMHVVPVLNGRTIFEHARRINTGGYNVVTFLHRMLQLKYPAHAAAITLSRAEELVQSICLVARDYREELTRWNDADYYERHTKKIQLPFNANATSVGLSAEQQKERKRELAKRLSEMNARRRNEKLAEDEERLIKLTEIQELLDVHDDVEEFEYALGAHGIEGQDELEKQLVLLRARIEKTRQKINAALADDPLLDEPASKQVKLNKIVFESEKALQLYVANAKRMRQEILARKLARKQRKADMAKRRTAAGQERMRIISQLARKEKGNDDFGMRDEDWDIYKTISRDGGDSDSEAENEKLLELEEAIKSHQGGRLAGDGSGDAAAPAEAHQLHIGVERYRAPELLFKPYMVGSTEAGLGEVMGYVLRLFADDEQLRLAGNVVLMGGLSQLAGLRERIQAELTPIRPFRSHSAVIAMPATTLAPWQGARKFANTVGFLQKCVSREEYEECGAEFFKSHIAANPYTPSPNHANNIEVDI